jgi:hypothetical protein
MSDQTAGGQVGEPVDDGQVSIEDLQKMLDEARGRASNLEKERDEERRFRQTVERDRDVHAQRSVSEAERRYNAEMAAVAAQLAAATDTLASAKAAFKTALAEGEHDKAVDAQELIARSVSQRDWAENKKSYLESNKTQFVQPQQRQDADEYGGVQIIPEERQWLSSRPQFKSDQTYRNRVISASGSAVADGHTRGSEGYFRRMEEILGENQRKETPRPEADEAPAHRPSADVAPNRRTQPGAQPSGRVRVELSADEREVADAMYGNPTSNGFVADEAARYEKYFKQKQAMKASGRL